MTRLITVMTYNVHGFFLAAFIFHRKLKSWTGKKKKNCIKVLSSLYRPLFILSQTSVQSTKVTKRSPMQPFNNKKKRNGPVTWGALHLSSIRSLWNLSIIKRVDNINWPL